MLTREQMIDADSPFLNGRIDRCVQELAGGSRSHVTGLFDHECVTLNGAVETNHSYRLQVGDRVSVRYEENRRYSPKPHRRQDHRGFSIVYEDRAIIVVEKAPELLTVPTDANEPHSLIDRVNEYVSHEKGRLGAHVVHRLDRGVSGLLVFGKTHEYARELQRQFAQRKPQREYRAIVAGSVEASEGEFRSQLATGKGLQRYSTKTEGEGELAITHFQVLERLRTVTLLTARLETGRRNQIRVHLAEAGHPVLGDQRYRPDISSHPNWKYRRMALHAALLAFHHPVTEEPLSFSSEMPKQMQLMLRKERIATASAPAERNETPPARERRAPKGNSTRRPKRN